MTCDSVMTARIRAACNREHGGIVLTCQRMPSDENGSHVRVLLDGGNMEGDDPRWVLSYAYGGGYDYYCEAMATAVAFVIGVKTGMDDPHKLDYSNWSLRNWPAVAKENGWTLYMWETAKTVVLIPDEAKAEEIRKGFAKWEKKRRVHDKEAVDRHVHEAAADRT